MKPPVLKLARYLVIPSVALLAAPTLKATDDNWTAGTSDWALPGNWSNATVPDASVAGADEANISNAGEATISSVVPNVLNVYVGKNGGSTGTLNIAAGGALTITGTGESLKIGTDGGNGILNQTGGTLTQTAGDFRLGNYGAGASGVYNLSGGTATVNQVRIGIGNATQTGALNQTGGSLTNTGEFKVGSQDATGTYSLSGATSVAHLNDVKVGQYVNSTGTFTQSAGTLTISGETQVGSDGGTGTMVINNAAASATINSLRVGQSGGSVGTMNHSAGTVANGSELFVGLNGGSGTYNLSGTAVLTSVNRIRLAVGGGSVGVFNQSGGTLTIADGERLELSEDGGTATYNLSGGSLNMPNGDILVGGFGTGGSGTFNQTGGTATVGRVRVAFDPGKTGALNLNGGVMSANAIVKEPAPNGGTATISFNGGTAQARQDNGAFIDGFSTVTINAGGAKIDSNGHNIGINAPLSGTGGVTKLGAGTLTLSLTNLQSGTTIVSAGTLATDVAGTFGTGDINVQAGATLAIGNFSSISNTGSVTFTNTSSIVLPGSGTEVIGALYDATTGTFAPVNTYTFDQLNSIFGSTVFSGTGSIQVTAVPEPSTLALGAAGLVLLVVAVRRRKTVAA